MKDLIITRIVLCALLFSSLTGCSELDEGSKGAVSGETFYADELSLSSGITGIYGIVQRGTWGVDILAGYTGADDLTTHTTGNKWVFQEGDQLSISGGNQRTIVVWTQYYKAINACNSFIENANPEGVDETIVNSFKADAHFIRGLLYFRLAMIFGDIPLVTSPVPDYELFKSPSREVIALVISDMEYAAQWAINERDEKTSIVDGHATKTAAKAFLAKAYMQLTGFPFNETDKWEQVRTYTEEIINDGVYSLVDNYKHNFGKAWENNEEIIWAHQFDKAAWPIGTESRWYGDFWDDWMDMYIEWQFYDGVAEGYRKKFCFSTTSSHAVKYSHPVLTKLSYGTVAGLPEYEASWQTSNDIPVMRYSEVLLMAAEAQLNGGDKTKGVEYLNQVRRRAYAKNSATSDEVDALPSGFWKEIDADYDLSSNLTNEELIEATLNERAWEFVAEPGGNRWLDLVRLELVGPISEERDPRELPFIGDPYNSEDWYAPIPDSEIAINPNLK